MKVTLISRIFILLLAGAACLSLTINRPIQNQEPWKPAQLMAPADLAKSISTNGAKGQYIYCVGPGAVIKGSIDIGPAKEKANLDKFRQTLSKLPKDATVIIYCGCCPFVHCPNIRPAFTLLNEMGFTNARLLNLEQNIRVDWIAKGYPVEPSGK